MTAAEERAYTAMSLKFAIGCQTTSPDRLAHYSTANVARDLDLLRQAVGDDKLSYVGYSYGTYLGATYARLFPSKIRAFVLDGTLSPEGYSGSDGDRRPIGDRLRRGEGAAETFAQFLAECEKAGPNDCALAKLGDPKAVAESTFERLKTHPVVLTLPDGSTVTVTYQVAGAPHFGRMRLWFGQPCEFMALKDHDAFLGPWKLTTKTPVMVIGTPVRPGNAVRGHTSVRRPVPERAHGHGRGLRPPCSARAHVPTT